MPYEVLLPGDFVVSDDQDRLDLDVVHRYIAEESYWGRGREREILERSVRNSLCFGLYAPDGAQAGFARVLSDRATRAHLNDVFVLPPYRGRGLGEAVVASVLAHPELATVTTWTLSTDDAHGLYRKFGFGPIDRPEAQMIRQTTKPRPSGNAGPKTS